jgi:hypothetical protein
MVKTRISSTDLAWIFKQKLNEFDDCVPSVAIAIIPNGKGWRAVASSGQGATRPRCVKRVEQIQKQLSGIYVLASD